MSREKLKSLGLEIPILPTTSVGSFPKPPDLMNARSKFKKKEISAEELARKEDDATRFWIRTQEEIGIDVLVDGEQYRGDMVEYFAQNMDGFKISGLVRSYGNRYYHKPILAGKIVWNRPITVERWKFAQTLTSKPVKGMLTGPYTIMDWSFNEHYKTRRHATFALAEAVRHEVEALVKAGCKIIQIDEPAVSVRFEEIKWACQALKEVVSGLDAYFITHCCYGDFARMYDLVVKYLPVDNLDIELSNSNFDLLEQMKKRPFKKDISAGVVDVHSHVIETAETVSQRIANALKVLKPEQVWVDPDCGLKTRQVDEAIDKLKAIVGGTKAAREKLANRKLAAARK